MLGTLIKVNKGTSAWIHGHQEIPGNEEGDRLTKGGAIEVSPNQFTAVPFSVGKKNSSRSIWNCSIKLGGLPVLAADSPKC